MHFIDILIPLNIWFTFFLLIFKTNNRALFYGQLSYHAGNVPGSDALFQGLLCRFGQGLAGLHAPHPTLSAKSAGDVEKGASIRLPALQT